MASFYTQLLGTFGGGGGPTIIGGPWPGARVVVRDVFVIDAAGDSTYAVCFGSSDGIVIAGWIDASPPSTLHWVGSQALTDGDSLSAATDGTDVSFRVSGWVLLPFS